MARQLQLIDARPFRTAAEQKAWIGERIDRLREERRLRKAWRKKKAKVLAGG